MGQQKYVKIKIAPPVDNKHGITVGRVFQVTLMAEDHEVPYLFVQGDAGEEVGLMYREVEYAQNPEG